MKFSESYWAKNKGKFRSHATTKTRQPRPDAPALRSLDFIACPFPDGLTRWGFSTVRDWETFHTLYPDAIQVDALGHPV
jgi:hypothetical protein